MQGMLAHKLDETFDRHRSGTESRYDRRLGPATSEQRLISVWSFELLHNDVSWEIRLGRGHDKLISEITLTHVVQESLVHQIIMAQSEVKSIVCTAIDPH